MTAVAANGAVDKAVAPAIADRPRRVAARIRTVAHEAIEIREGPAWRRSRLRAPARPFLLFAARRRAADRAARGARQGRPAAGAGADRHRQHVRRAGILREAGRLRHPADRRLLRSPSISATRSAIRGSPDRRAGLPRIVLLAAREEGYRSLMRLNSRAFLETPSNETPHLKLAWLEGVTGGLIALTGGPGGAARRCDRGRAGRACGRAAATTLQKLFGDRLYVELQRHGTAGRAAAEPALIDLAYAQGHSARRHQRALSSPGARITRRTTR